MSPSKSSKAPSLFNYLHTFLISPIKRILCDPLFSILAWLINILAVLLISFLRTLFDRTTNVNLLYLFTTTTTTTAPPQQQQQKQQKQKQKQKQKQHNILTTSSSHTMSHHSTHHTNTVSNKYLASYLSALMVPSALSNMDNEHRKSLVLDLDETLVHSQFKPIQPYDVKLQIDINLINTVFYVSKRPYLDIFLTTVSKWYDVCIFTASVQKYGDPLISILDCNHVVKRRIFRQDCIKRNGNFIKDLTIVNDNLADVIIIDNSPVAYSIQPHNAIPILPWYHDQNDEELLNLLPLLHALAFLNDVRSILDLRLTAGALVNMHAR